MINDFLIVAFCILSILSFLPYNEDRRFKKAEKIIFVLLWILLLGFAALRPEGQDRDYLSYKYWFLKNRENVEISFQWISQIVKSAKGEFIILIFVYALLGVTTKFIAIRRMSVLPIVSLLAYISYLYPIHELTQIRAGVASGFVLLAISYKARARIWGTAICIGLAILFHYSSIVMLPLIFIKTEKFNRVYYSLAILFSYIAFSGISVLLNLVLDYLPPVLKWKVMAYESEVGADLNIFNAWQILRILIALFMIFNIKTLMTKDKNFALYLKIYVIGICSFVLLSFNPVFAVRVSDLYFVIDIILITGLIHIIPNYVLSRVLVILVTALFLFLNISYIDLFLN